jgi:prolipoprotein diacylglyceryl transferase
MILGFIRWDVSPEIFSIGSFSIRWYGLLFASAFFFGYIIMKKIFEKENLAIEWLDKLSIYMLIGTVLGARLGHVIFYQPGYYLEHPLEILQVWKGGLASHGASLGILAALYLFSKKSKKSYLWILDRVVIVIGLGGFFVRMGNLMNSEIVGNITDVPWAFVFVREIPYLGDAARHPSQIYEGLSYLLLFAVLMFMYFKKESGKKAGLIFGIFLIGLFSARFIIEFYKDVQVGFEEGMRLNMGQILSIPFILLGIYFLVNTLTKTRLKKDS